MLAPPEIRPGLPKCPVPGTYRTRLAKGGPWVPARIMLTDGLWLVLVAGHATGEPKADPWRVRKMEWIAFSTPITEDEYAALMAAHADATDDHPLADSTARVDWRRGRSIF